MVRLKLDFVEGKMIKPMQGFKKIYPLNGYKISKTLRFSKYISFKRLKENVDKKNIVFVSPKLWEDPFEQIYYRADFEKYNYQQPNIFCMCLTENATQNEAAAWKMYQDGTEKMIQVRLWAEKMLQQLDRFCQSNHFSVYIGKMNYGFLQKEIESLYKEHGQIHEDYFPKNFCNEHYLKLLLLKRRSFEFENEVRIFVIPDNNKSDDSEKLWCEFPFDYNNGTIYSVKAAPLQPFPIGDPRHENYEKIQEVEAAVYKEALKKILPTLDSTKIRQSHLYEPEKIIKL